MNKIIVKEKVVNNGEVETRFAGKKLTSRGGDIKLFYKQLLSQVVHSGHSSENSGDKCKPAG